MELSPETLQDLAGRDPDRVRAAQLAAPADRAALLTLYAFHLELAKTPERVSQPLIGQMRYQFWRDALDEIYAGKPPRAHEVVAPLAALIRERDVARYTLDTLIDARERDLDPRPFSSLDAARDYARATSGGLVEAALEVVGAEATPQTAALGEAWGLVGLARAWRFYKGSMLQNIAHGALLDAAREAFARGRGKQPVAAVPALAYAAFVPLYARAMSKPGYTPDMGRVEVGAVAKQTRLLRAALSGRI